MIDKQKFETCDHNDYDRNENIGYDVSDQYEENQHIDECKICGARRLVMEIIPYDGLEPIKTIEKKWEIDGYLFSTFAL